MTVNNNFQEGKKNPQRAGQEDLINVRVGWGLTLSFSFVKSSNSWLGASATLVTISPCAQKRTVQLTSAAQPTMFRQCKAFGDQYRSTAMVSNIKLTFVLNSAFWHLGSRLFTTPLSFVFATIEIFKTIFQQLGGLHFCTIYFFVLVHFLMAFCRGKHLGHHRQAATRNGKTLYQVNINKRPLASRKLSFEVKLSLTKRVTQILQIPYLEIMEKNKKMAEGLGRCLSG